MNLAGNTLFIPGGTSGIGLALARRLKDRGDTVIVGGRRPEPLERLRAEGFDAFVSTPPTRRASPTRHLRSSAPIPS